MNPLGVVADGYVLLPSGDAVATGRPVVIFCKPLMVSIRHDVFDDPDIPDVLDRFGDAGRPGRFRSYR